MLFRTIPLIFIILFCNIAYSSTHGIIFLESKQKIIVEIVRSPKEMRLGLGYRTHLDPNKGMLFLYTNTNKRIFWMKNMKIAIDIIWIRAGIVQWIEKNVPPPSPMALEKSLKRYGHSIYADMVLELAAGEAERFKIQLNSKLRLSQ